MQEKSYLVSVLQQPTVSTPERLDERTVLRAQAQLKRDEVATLQERLDAARSKIRTCAWADINFWEEEANRYSMRKRKAERELRAVEARLRGW